MPIKAVQYGLGAMGTAIARLVLKKQGIELVGAISRRAEKRGVDLGDALELGTRLGIPVSDDAGAVLWHTRPDLVLHATCSYIKEAYPEVAMAIQAGANVISLCEELSYPLWRNADVAGQLDALAKEHDVTVLGTGINPGFIYDTVILALSAACQDIDRIRASRGADLSMWGPSVLRAMGVGVTVEEFADGLKSGVIYGHLGYAESIAMIADGLGWQLDRITQRYDPIVSENHRSAKYVEIFPGRTAGLRQYGYGIKDGQAVISLELTMEVGPEQPVDVIEIAGIPPINITINPATKGGYTAPALVVNMIPKVVAAPSGLTSMKDLPLPAAALGNLSKLAGLSG